MYYHPLRLRTGDHTTESRLWIRGRGSPPARAWRRPTFPTSPPPSCGCSTFPCPLLSTVDRCRCRVELICPKARCTVLESSLESFVPACATLGSARARRAEAVSKPRLNDQSRILISPSWAADAMSRPSREYTAPRLKPRAPDADGLSCANRSHSSARKARWNHIA